MAQQDINTVPLGEAGTGAAYLLPQSQAVNQAYLGIDQIQADKQANADAKVKQAQAVANAWKKNQLNIKGGTLYQPEINDRTSKVMQMGYQLQKAGVNPNTVSNDPEVQKRIDQYNQAKSALISDAQARDEYAKQSQENEKLIAAQPAGYFDPQSISDYHDFISGKIPLSTITSKGLQMPALRRTYDMQTAIDKLPTAKIDTKGLPDKNGVQTHLILPDENAHLNTANNFVQNTPEVQAEISRKTGVPYAQIPDETDPNVIKKQLDDHYRSLPNIPSLAAQGVKTFGYGDTNSNGIPDAQAPVGGALPTSQPGTPYDNLITTQAKQLANAAKLKASTIMGVKQQLDDKVGKTNDQDYNFKYQDEMRARQRMGMETQKFSAWLQDQQNEAGQFSLGNQNSYVPVITQYNDGKGKGNYVKPEAGASLYGVNLPAVKTVVTPSMVTNMNTGKTVKNTGSLDVDISQIRMVPVWKGLSDNDPRNGSELSARELKQVVSGTHNFGNLSNITFQPYAYGIQHLKDDKNIHTADIPVKFSYDALKGSNVKKINTSTFDQATEGLKQLQANPKFQSLSPQDQLNFISQRYNLKLE